MCLVVSVYSHPCSPPSCAQTLGRVGLGGQAWAKLSSSSVLPPGTVSLCWTWTGWKVHGASRHLSGWPWAGSRTGPSSVCPPQVLRVHAGLRLLEGPLCPRGHCRSQLAQSWWQGRSAMCHRHWQAESMLAQSQAGG